MFNDNFDIFLANTPESKAIHYNLRYKVYCEEMEYEDKDKFSSEHEKDKWDENAVHFLLRAKNTNEWVGAVRLVFRNGNLLPMEELSPVKELINNKDGFSEQLVEVSRLCIIKDIRRRRAEETIDHPYGNSGRADVIHKEENVKVFYSRRKLRQNILFGLLHAAAKYSVENHINDWYWLGTEALARILRKSSLNIVKIGESCQHRGKRFPFKMDPIQTFLALNSEFEESYFLYSELNDAYTEPLQATA